MTIVLGIEKTHVAGGEDRFALQLLQDGGWWTESAFCSVVVNDLTEELVRRICASRSISGQDLNHYLALARLSYHVRGLRVS